MKIAIARETGGDERRVAVTPETVKRFAGLGASVSVESGAGLASQITDAELTAAGCDIVLHCNGVMEEMQGIVSRVKPLAGKSLERANRALAAIGGRGDEQEQLVRAEFATYFEAVA